MSFKTAKLICTQNYLHVYNRGVNRNTLFFRSVDYEYFIELMAGTIKSSDLALLLYVLMPNHFHIVVQQRSPYAISRFTKHVCEVYARYVNRTRTRSGHLFQNRFRVDTVEDPGSLLRLSRYIHFNPVEAGLVESYLDWAFGSGRFYGGSGDSSFISSDPLFSLTGGRANYSAFLANFDPADPESVWQFLPNRKWSCDP